jgi:hypothetical protein
MFKKYVFSFLIALKIGSLDCSILDACKEMFYASHCAGNEYYKQATNTKYGVNPLQFALVYSNTLLVHLLFPAYLAIIANTKTTEKNLTLTRCAETFGKMAHESFIVPAIGAALLFFVSYYVAKKIIHLIRS